MQLQTTLSYLDALYRNVDPVTGNALPTNSVFSTDRVRYALDKLQTALREGEPIEPQAGITDEELLGLCNELVTLGYAVTRQQLVHILRGSRRIADPHLRGLLTYGKYRALYNRAAIEQFVKQFAQRNPEPFNETLEEKPKRTPKPWLQEPFFNETQFDKLDPEKEVELQQEIAAIPLQRAGEKVPAFIARIRERYARSFEPWTKAERALLLETMCYTNDAARIGTLFGRSPKAISGEGKRLIYQSRMQHAAGR